MTTLDLPTFLLLALVICGIVGVVLLVSRVAAGRADPRPELGFIAGQRVEVKGFWLWRRSRLFATVQYTYRGVPIGHPIEKLVAEQSEIDAEAFQRALDVATALGAPHGKIPRVIAQAAKAVRLTASAAEVAAKGPVKKAVPR